MESQTWPFHRSVNQSPCNSLVNMGLKIYIIVKYAQRSKFQYFNSVRLSNTNVGAGVKQQRTKSNYSSKRMWHLSSVHNDNNKCNTTEHQ